MYKYLVLAQTLHGKPYSVFTIEPLTVPGEERKLILGPALMRDRETEDGYDNEEEAISVLLDLAEGVDPEDPSTWSVEG